MNSSNTDRDKRTGGTDQPATGTTGVGTSEDTDVSPLDAAEDINPGNAGTAAPDPRNPDGGA